MDKYTQIGLLYDFYGRLLTKKQQEVLSLYYEDNFSLSEIAEEMGISRQGVHGTLKSGEALLTRYEDELMLAKKLGETRKAMKILNGIIEELGVKGEQKLQNKLYRVKDILEDSSL